MSVGVFVIVIAAVLLGCFLQRTSGMGTGLVVSPTLVLVIGPVAGVLLTNVTTVVSALLMTITMWHDVDWRRFARIAPTIVLGAVPAALVIRVVDTGWLEVVIGVVLLLALGGTGLIREIPGFRPLSAGMFTGVVGGFLNTSAGVSAPAMLVYAHMTQWAQRPFAATLQPIFLTMGIMSVATKVVFGATGSLSLPQWPLVVAVMAAVPVGVVVGGWIARHVRSTTARHIAVVLVTIGASATLVRGLLRVVGG